MLACEKLEVFFFSRQNYLKKTFATQISRPNACRLLSSGPIEGQSVQKYTPHNRTTQRRYTPRDSSRQLRHFWKSIPEFGETHSSVLGYERRPVSASIVSRSCFSSFPVCVYKFSSHYLNNIIFIDNRLGPLATESPSTLSDVKSTFSFSWLDSPTGSRPLLRWGFEITFRNTIFDRAPLDEWSAGRNDLYLTTHNTHRRRTSMPKAGLEPAIPAYNVAIFVQY